MDGGQVSEAESATILRVRSVKVGALRWALRLVLIAAGLFTVYAISDRASRNAALVGREAARDEFARLSVQRVAPTQRAMDSLYIATLERANQRFTENASWMSIFVGALGVLFTAGAIVASLLLYLQSAEHKQQLRQSLQRFSDDGRQKLLEHQSLVESFLTDAKAEVGKEIETLQKRQKESVGKAPESDVESLNRLKAIQANLTAATSYAVPEFVAQAATSFQALLEDRQLANRVAKLIADSPGIQEAGLTINSVDVRGALVTVLAGPPGAAPSRFVHVAPIAVRQWSDEEMDGFIVRPLIRKITKHFSKQSNADEE